MHFKITCASRKLRGRYAVGEFGTLDSPALYQRLEEACRGPAYVFRVTVTDRPLKEAQAWFWLSQLHYRPGVRHVAPAAIHGERYLRTRFLSFHRTPSSRKPAPTPAQMTLHFGVLLVDPRGQGAQFQDVSPIDLIADLSKEYLTRVPPGPTVDRLRPHPVPDGPANGSVKAQSFWRVIRFKLDMWGCADGD